MCSTVSGQIAYIAEDVPKNGTVDAQMEYEHKQEGGWAMSKPEEAAKSRMHAAVFGPRGKGRPSKADAAMRRDLEMAISTGVNVPTITPEQIEAAVEARRTRSGRPSKFNSEVAAEIIERLSNGETLTSITKSKKMPAHGTVCDWMRKIPDFGEAVARARLDQTEARVDMAEEALQAVDGTAKDNQVRKAEAVARFTLEVASRRNFAVFGEKKQSLNVNVNADVCPVDLSKYLNR